MTDDIITQQKADAIRARFEAVIGILQDWSNWHKGYRIRVGYPPKSAGFQSGGSVSDDTSEHSYAAADNARFEIVEACVDDLMPAQNAAIYHRYCHTVYRMRDYTGSLSDAHDRLCIVFRQKGIMW